MNIQPISPSFKGVTSSNSDTDKLDAFINMDDNSLRKIAYLETSENFNDKKNRRITNALFYSAPVAAGLKTAVFSDGSATKVFSKQVTGLAAKAAKGLKVAGLFAATLGALDLFALGVNKLTNKSEKAKKFNNEHRLLSLGAMLAAGLGIISLSTVGAAKLATLKAPKFLRNATGSVAKFMNTNKHIVKMQTRLANFNEKVPTALKDIGSTVLDWAPTSLLLGGFFHSIASANNKNKDFVNNYSQLRDLQTDLTRQRLNQLVAENDTLNLINEDNSTDEA